MNASVCRIATRTITAIFALAIPFGQICAASEAKSSAPGLYRGWDVVQFDGYAQTSQYITMRDGTRIAVDILRPTLNGKAVEAPLPVLWMNTPYNRRGLNGDFTARDYPGAALALVKYGYVVAIADMRGNYASFGKAVHSNRNEWMPWAYWDAYDVTEWLAAQSWSSGKVGMWGCSATGHSQWQAAASHPPHLKAIFPMSAPSEYYDWGGMVAVPSTQALDNSSDRDKQAARVDADSDGALLAAAKAEHKNNIEPGYMPFRDSPSPELALRLGMKDYRYWLEVNSFNHFKDIAASGIPAYQSGNYGEDIRVKQGVFIKRASLTNPIKTIIAPGNHCEWSSDFVTKPGNAFNIVTEERRWFDHWLKNVPNGIMVEPSLLYYTFNAPKDDQWRQAWQWPLPTEKRASFYFAGGASPREGVLDTLRPSSASASDSYVTDYSVANKDVDTKGQTYMTAPLPTDTTLTGHSIIDLWVSSTASDGDFVAWLEDVAPDGSVTRLPGSEDGRLRASHRKLGQPAYNNLGLPYHRSYSEDFQPIMPGEPTELVFDMAPVSYVFKSDHRIRIVIVGVAATRHGESGITPILSPPPVITFYHDVRHPSRIDLPLSAPVSARATAARSTSGLTVTLHFPATLDVRYLDDVTPGSVKLGGQAALSVMRKGRDLVVLFAARPTRRAPIQVNGTFGDRYHYGAEARFVAAVKLTN